MYMSEDYKNNIQLGFSLACSHYNTILQTKVNQLHRNFSHFTYLDGLIIASLTLYQFYECRGYKRFSTKMMYL